MALVFLESLETAAPAKRTARPPNTIVEIGKPLLITIEHFYTGNAPQKRKLFGGHRDLDLLVSSSIKAGLGTFEASPLYINFIREKVGDNNSVSSTADTRGTELVYYTDALDTDHLELTFNVIFDRFDQELVKHIANALSNAAKLPVFTTASGYLLTASKIIHIGAKLGSALYDGKPYLTNTLKIDLRKDDDFRGFLIMCNEGKTEETFFNRCKVKIQENRNGEEKAVLLDPDTQEVYAGDFPYLMLRISSEARIDLANFTPHVLSGAMLEKFYGEDGSAKDQVLDVAKEALVFYNDQQYLGKINEQRARIASGKLSADEQKKAKALVEAYGNNIQSKEFKQLLSPAKP